MLRHSLDQARTRPERQHAALTGAFGLGSETDPPDRLLMGALLVAVDDTQWAPARRWTCSPFVSRRPDAESVSMLLDQAAGSPLALIELAGVAAGLPAQLPAPPGAFANDLSRDTATMLAASQRAVTLGALTEPSGLPAGASVPALVPGRQP